MRLRLIGSEDDGEEIDYYGAVEYFCLVGETTVGLGSGLVVELVRKVSALRRESGAAPTQAA